MELVKGCNGEQGKPRYLDEHLQSSIKLVSYEKYRTMTTQEVQGYLRYRHLLITGMPTEAVEFDEAGLQELTNLQSKVHFHGE